MKQRYVAPPRTTEPKVQVFFLAVDAFRVDYEKKQLDPIFVGKNEWENSCENIEDIVSPAEPVVEPLKKLRSKVP